jgi:hypothetical protein
MIRIEIDQGGLADPESTIRRGLLVGLTKTVAFLERDIKPRMPRGATGLGRQSIAGEVQLGASGGLGVAVGRIGSPLKHVAVINDGRRPGQKAPPAEALELWVRRKIRHSRRKGPRGGLRKLTVSEAKGIAFVIARKIGREGIEAHEMFEKSVQENEARIREFFAEAGAQITIHMTRGGN